MLGNSQLLSYSNSYSCQLPFSPKPSTALSYMSKNTPTPFLNSCPLELDELPKTKCPNAEECPWGIASEKHGKCFWKLIKQRSNEFGEFTPVPQNELITILGWGSAKVNAVTKEAQTQLETALTENSATFYEQ